MLFSPVLFMPLGLGFGDISKVAMGLAKVSSAAFNVGRGQGLHVRMVM